MDDGLRVHDHLDLVGQTQGSQDTEIRARVEGYLQSIHFTEGSFVAKDDLLYEIDKDKAARVLAGQDRFDESSMLDFLSILFQGVGYEVTTARSVPTTCSSSAVSEVRRGAQFGRG